MASLPLIFRGRGRVSPFRAAATTVAGWQMGFLGPLGAPTFFGTIALSGSGTLGAVGLKVIVGSVSLSGSGGLSAAGGPLLPPTFVTSVLGDNSGNWASQTSPKTTPGINGSIGDVLASVAGIANHNATNFTWTSTPTETWTEGPGSTAPANTDAFAQAASAILTAARTGMTVDVARTAGSGVAFDHRVARFSNSSGIGNSAASGALSTNASWSFTTNFSSSAILCIFVDWGAVSGASRTWRTVNGTTPTAGNGFELDYFSDGVNYSIYVAYYPDAGAAGAKTLGLTAPTGGTTRFVAAAIEIRGKVPFLGSTSLSGSGSLSFPTKTPTPIQTVNLSGSGTLFPAPPIGYLQDDFTTQDTDKWTGWNANVTISSGRLAIVGSGNYDQLKGTNWYNLTGSSFFAELVQPLTLGNGSTDSFMRALSPGDVYNIDFGKGGPNLYMRVATPSGSSATTFTYDPILHRWLRIRESGGDYFLETAPDGLDWTTRRTITGSGFDPRYMRPAFIAGTWNSSPSPGTALFDNFNITPSRSVYFSGTGSLRFGGVATPDPATVSGLRGRWKAATISGSPSSGSLVSSWTDSSGAGANATQGWDAQQPIYRSIGSFLPNGKPVVEFSSVFNSNVSVSGDFGGAATRFVVARVKALPTASSTGTMVSTPLQLGIFNTSGKISTAIENVQWLIQEGNAAVPLNTWVVIAMSTNGSNDHRIYLNGTQDATTTSAHTHTSSGLTIGSTRGGAEGSDSYIAEVFDFSGVLSAIDRAKVHTYIQDEYGIIVSDYNGGTGTLGSGTDFTGSAGLSGSGTLSFAAIPTPIQTINLSGSGTLTAPTRVPALVQTANLSGSGTLTGTPQAIAVSGAAALSGSGTLSFVAIPTPIQTVNLSGSGTLSFVAVPKPAQTVNLSGSGTLTEAQQAIAVSGAATLSGSGALSFVAVPTPVQTTNLSGSGTLSFVAVPKPIQTFNLSGSGTLSLVGVVVAFREQLGSLTPVAWWRLEEVSGTTAADSAGANPGTYTGSPTLGATGLAPADSINLAADFVNNALRYVEVAHASTLNPASLSITALIDPASINGNNRIYEKGFSDSGVALKVEGTNLELYINGHVTVDHPLSRLGTGRRFIVGTYDSTTGRGTIFVDGRPVATAVGTSGSAPTPTDPLRIGQKPGGTANSDGWNGKLQHVALFDRVLTNTEIADLGDRAVVEPDYVWWKNELWTLANRGVFSPYVNSFSGKQGRIDNSGYLHLNVANTGGGNSIGTEVASITQGRGYGTYTVQVGSQISGIHPNVVFGGMFTYGADASYGHREIDAGEQSAWSGATGPWTLGHVVWAPSSSSDPEAARGGFDAADITTLTDSSQTTVMIWTPGSITFRTYHGLSTASGDLFRESVVTAGQVVTFDVEGGGSYTGPILLPVPEDERVHLNLWVCPNYSGTSDPATVTNTDIIIRDFSFVASVDVSGSVALSGSGTLTLPTRVPGPVQTVNLSGSGTLSLTKGALMITGAVALSGSGTLTGTQQAIAVSGSVALSGSGTLTFPTQIPTPIQTVNLSGTGTLSGIAGTFTGSVALSGSGTLTVPTRTPSFVQVAALSGSGTLSFTAGIVAVSGAAALSGSGTLSFTAGTVAVSGSVSLSGAGTLSFTPIVGFARTVNLSGSGTLSLVGVLVSVGSVALSGSGTLTIPTRVPTPIQTVNLSGSGTLSTAAVVAVSGSAVLSGSGTLSFVAVPSVARTVALSGSGTLSLVGVLVSVGSVTLSGSGTLTLPTRVPSFIQTVNLSGSGTLTLPTRTPAIPGTVALNGSGVLDFPTQIPTPKVTVALNGSGVLSLFGFKPTGGRSPGTAWVVVSGVEVPMQLKAVVGGVLVSTTWALP